MIFSDNKIGALEELRMAVEKMTAQYNEGEEPKKKKGSLVSRDHHFNTLLMEIKHAFI